jgi:hypothetical protein
MRHVLLTAVVWCSVPALAQTATSVGTTQPSLGQPVATPKVTPADVIPSSEATEAFEWQPRPVTKFDLARRARVARLSARQALDAFYAASNTPGLQDKWPDVSAYFEVHPEAMTTAYGELKADRMAVNAIVPFYIALGKARVPEAKALLLSIVRDLSAPPMDRTRAMFALVDRDDVGLELV